MDRVLPCHLAIGFLCGLSLSSLPAESPPPAEVPAKRTAARDGFLANELQRVDPEADGWESEVFHDAIKPLLKKFTAHLGKRKALDQKALQKWCSPNMQVSALRPGSLSETKLEGGFTIRRNVASLDNAKRFPFSSFKNQVTAWFTPFAKAKPIDIHIKIFRVSQNGHTGTATVYVDATGPSNNTGIIQQNITWTTKWTRKDENTGWKLSEVAPTAFEEVESAAAEPLFSDVTEAALAKTDAWRSQLRYSLDHWRLRLDASLSIEAGGTNGLAIGDVNGDGLEDVFYTDSGGLPKRLLLHQPDGTVVDRTKEAGLDFLDRSRAALLVDFDNDGDQDLAMALEDRILILANNGQGQFKKATSLPAAARVHGLGAADYDSDGLTDFYACSYGRDFSTFGEEGVPMPWSDANNGAVNALFHNKGNLRFENTTKAVGMDVNNNRFSFAACWEDFNQDGWIDLYVANDFGRNNLYQNNRGRFEDVAAKVGAPDPSPGMAVSWGDVNNDGWMDLHVSNMFSGAGNRITPQPRYAAGRRKDILEEHRRFARGNSLLLSSNNSLKFTDVSESAGITLGRWAWGNQFADINNDGRLDSLVGNGFISGPEEDDL